MDANQLLDNIDRRIYELEQLLTSSTGPGSNAFDSIIINNPGGGSPVTIQYVSSPPTSLVVTPGTFFDTNYADVSWTAPVDGSADTYQVEWAKKNGPGSYDLINALGGLKGNSFRIPNLLNNQDYGVRVYTVNKAGVPSTPLPSSGYTDFHEGADASAPATPTGLVVVSTIKGIIARITPNSERDTAFGKGTYKFELSTNAGFTGIIKTNIEGGVVSYFPDLAVNTQYWVRAYAIDASGNASGPTAGASATTNFVQGSGGGATSDLNGTVTANEVFAGSMTTAIFTVNTLNGDRLLANSAVIEKLSSSSMTSVDITLSGGSFKAGTPPTTGLLINSQGLRLYSGGSQTVTIDVGGTASFTGTITATAGTLVNLSVTGVLTMTSSGLIRTNAGGSMVARTEIATNSGGTSEVTFFTGDPSETQRGYVQVGSSGYLSIVSPAMSGHYGYINIFSTTMNIGNQSRTNVTFRESGSDDFWNDVSIHGATSFYNSISTIANISAGTSYNGVVCVNSGGSPFGGDANWALAWRTGNTYAGLGYATSFDTELRYYSTGSSDWSRAIVLVDTRTNTIVAGCANDGTFAYLSSRGIKTKIKKMASGTLEDLMKLRPVSHGLKKFGNNRYSGLISQEVGVVWPDAVIGSGDDATGIVPAAMFSRLVHAVQETTIEHRAETTSMNEKIEGLLNDVAVLKSHLLKTA